MPLSRSTASALNVPTALAISPHLDDAVFSAGGTLAQLAREGWRVIVATIFTASVPEPRGFALACQLDKGLGPEIDYMALRRAEDAAACAAIGAEPLWLPFVEAPHRGYASAAALFGGLRDDDVIVDRIMPAISELIRSHAPQRLFAPQAIGAHVDHIAVYLALQSCRKPMWLWRDFPYAVRPGALGHPFEHEMGALTDQDIELGSEDLAAKVRATTAYASQLGFQFGGRKPAEAAIEMIGHVEVFKRTLL